MTGRSWWIVPCPGCLGGHHGGFGADELHADLSARKGGGSGLLWLQQRSPMAPLPQRGDAGYLQVGEAVACREGDLAAATTIGALSSV